MKIFVDGDACPVIDQTIEIAKNYGLETVIFCDTAHCISRENIRVVMVSKGSDAVDFRIVNEIGHLDILVTQDYGLAAMALARGAYPIHQNGFVYSNENIDQLLFQRHLGKEVRKRGGRTKGPSKRTKEFDEAYKKGLINLIEKLMEG